MHASASLPQKDISSSVIAISIMHMKSPVNAIGPIIASTIAWVSPWVSNADRSANCRSICARSIAMKCGRMFTVKTAARSPKNRVLWFIGRDISISTTDLL